jgi:hypothetical protein
MKATNRAKRRLTRIALFDGRDSPCRFTTLGSSRAMSANYRQINEKIRQLSGILEGVTVEVRIVPIFAAEGWSDLATRLCLGHAFVVGDSCDRRDGSGC